MTALEKAKAAAAKAAAKVNTVVEKHNTDKEVKEMEQKKQNEIDEATLKAALAKKEEEDKKDAEEKATAEAAAKKISDAKKRIKQLVDVLIPTNEQTLTVPTIPAEVKAFIEKQIADYNVELETLREVVGEKEALSGIDKYLLPVVTSTDEEIAKAIKDSIDVLIANNVLTVGGMYKVTKDGIQEIPQLVKDCPLKFHYSGMREANKKEKEASVTSANDTPAPEMKDAANQ